MPLLVFLFLGFLGGQVVTLPFVGWARISLLDVSVFVMVVLSIFASRPVKPRLWVPIALSALAMAISIAWNAWGLPVYIGGLGAAYLFRWLLYASLYWVSASSFLAPVVWRRFLMFVGIGVAVIGFIQYVLYPDLRNISYLGWDPHYQRLVSSLLDPNFTGLLLTLASIALIGESVKKKRSPVWVLGCIIVLIALALTYSRSSIIAFGVGILTWGVSSGRKKVTIGVLGVFALIVFLLPHTGEGRNLFRVASSYARIGSAARAWTLFWEKPILGHGFNILPYTTREQDSWVDRPVPSLTGAGIDTSLLFIAASSGVIGVTAFGWLLVSIFRLGVKSVAKKHTRELGAVYLGSVIALLMHSVFINSLFYPWVMAWLWIMTGALERELTADR